MIRSVFSFRLPPYHLIPSLSTLARNSNPDLSLSVSRENWPACSIPSKPVNARTPRGWSCEVEARVLDGRFEKLLGYAPQADVLLVSDDGLHRLWIKFEVSRADPVANHAKFATAHLFQPQRSTGTFVSMMSSHVARGRRNLAANTVLLMRRIGMKAFAFLVPLLARKTQGYDPD